MSRIGCITLAAMLALAAPATGGATLAADTTVAIVKRAAEHIRQQGPERAHADITAGDPNLFDADRHLLVVYSLGGRCLAHSANPRQVGRELFDLSDLDGRFPMRERLAGLRERPEGSWHEHRTLNTSNKKLEPRRMYCERVGETAVCASALH
jgi:cytochrome c